MTGKADNHAADTEAWNGVTIEELKFMRAAALIRVEMQKEYLKKKMAETLPIGIASPQNVFGGISGKISLIQKVFLFIKGVRMASNLISFFKKSRK